jgi:cell division protein FtsZ
MANDRKRDRASMREGPLAALFRKTEEEGTEPAAAKPPAREEAPAPSEPDSAPEPQRPSEAPVAREPEPPARGESSDPARPYGAPGDDDERNVPSPRERLRSAFSSEIPENILERSTADELTPQGPPRDVYARHETSGGIFSSAQPVGQPILRVVGVGGAGVNAVNRMIEAEVGGVEFIAINTDLQSLQQSEAPTTLHIGAGVTRGLGSGSNPDLGRQAAMEEYDKVKAALKGSDMLFVTAGAGGGTGTGAAPIVARIGRELGALTVGIVTKPFGFEGTRRREQADEGIKALAAEVDTLIVVPNNRLLSVLDKNTSMVEAFRVADDVLRQGVQGISDLVTLPGLINLDFADVRTIMSEAGNALLGIGMGVGELRAVEASQQAVASPLLETSMDGAKSILLSITGGRDLSLWEVNEAAKTVAEAAHPEANIIFGAMVDEKLDDQVWVTVVATGYQDAGSASSRRGRLEEPTGEPRVARGDSGRDRGRGDVRRERAPEAPRRRERAPIGEDLDVPEFIPRG